MEKYEQISIEKKLDIFTKEIFEKKQKSKSPSSVTAPDSPRSNLESKLLKERKSLEYNENQNQNVFTSLMNEKEDPFSFESSTNIKNNPFLSNIKKSENISLQLKNEKISKSFMKVSSKITINSNLSYFIDNINQNFEFNDNSTSLLCNHYINDDDILYNDRILDSFSLTNINYNFNKKIKDSENILSTKKINNDKNDEIKNNKNDNSTMKSNALSEKENIIIEALIALDKDYYENNKDKNCFDIGIDIDEYDYEQIYKADMGSNGQANGVISDFEQKINVYRFINNRIKQYYNYYKKNKTYKLDENQVDINNFKNEIINILLLEKINESISFFSFKSIVMGLYILVINWLSNSHFKVYLNIIKEKKCDNIDNNNNNNSNNNNINNSNLDIFIELMEKYNTIKDICPFLERDFKEIVENFQKNQKIKFCLCELLTDLYWDYVFKIHHINFIFTKGYTVNNTNNKNIIFEEAKHSMKAIIDILIVYDTSYKKNIGEILDLPYIKKENIFLMSYILEYKKKANPFMINEPYIEKGDVSNESINNSKNKKNKKKAENKNTENFSLEEVYKYIQGDSDNKKGKRKKRKKKKKNKNEKNGNNDEKNKSNVNCNNDENEEPEVLDEPDPVVEEFIQYFIEFNKFNTNCVKIKPIISQEWLESIS